MSQEIAPAPAEVVVDASIAAMWVLRETYSAHALALARSWAREKRQPVAPSFMLTEAADAIYKRVRRRELQLSQAVTAMQVLLGFGVRLDERASLHERALVLAHDLNRPTPHDSYYLALAEHYGCDVWTGDERLYNAARGHFPRLRWIGTFVLPQ